MDEANRFLLITAEESDSSVGFYDSLSGDEVARIRVGHWPHELLLSADRRTAWVSNFGIKDYDERIGRPGSSISQIDVGRKVEMRRLFTFENGDQFERRRAPHGLALSKDERQLFVNVESQDALLIFDLADPHKKCAVEVVGFGASVPSVWPNEEVELPHGTHFLLADPDGRRLWVVAGRNGVSEIDLASRRRLRTFHTHGAARGLTYTSDGKRLIVSDSGRIHLVDPRTLVAEREFVVDGVRQFLYTQPTPDGRYLLAPAVWEGQVIRIDLASGDVERVEVGADPIRVLVNPAGGTMFVSHGRSRFIAEVGIATMKVVREIPTRGGPNGLDWSPYSPRPERKRLRFGACIPLSGRNIVEGQDLRLGYQFWQETVNDAGGIVVGKDVYDVDLVFADTRSETGPGPDGQNRIADETRRLIEEEGAQFLFGTYPSPPNEHSGRVANERQTPFVTSSGAAGYIYELGLDFVFGIMTSAKGYLNETFDFLARLEGGPETAVFVADDDPAATQDAITTAQYITEQSYVRVLTDTDSDLPRDEATGIFIFPHQNTDFERYLDTVEKLQPDVLVVTGHLIESVALVRAAARRRYFPKAIIFSVGPAIPAFATQLGDLAEHMMGTAMWSPRQRSFGHDRFVRPQWYADAFFRRFSKPASYLAAGATACGLVFEEAFRRVGSVNGVAVRDALKEVAFESFYSRIEFDENNLNADRRLLTIQLRRDKGEYVHVPLWPRPLAPAGDQAVWPFPGWTSQ